MLLDAKSQIAQVIKELQKKGNPTGQDAHQATQTLEKINDRFVTPIKKSKPTIRHQINRKQLLNHNQQKLSAEFRWIGLL